ncbi:potassium channel subfamily U member 1 [Molossus molossus]|uniref:potassium channel subfamily U member 1 n=1 Tax=Molossus molossus TaxID=27622 RepID=UPI001746AEBF|nr:potassium channel subfamily U member 1 [Molossus molossus]
MGRFNGDLEAAASKDGEELGRKSCTREIQFAFILSSLATFLGGLLILFISRILWRIIKNWQNIKGTGILLNLILSKSTGKRNLRSLYLHGVFRDRIEMLLSAQTFVGQVLVILVFVLSIGSLIIYFINSADPVGSCSSYEDKTIPIDLTFNAFFTFYFGLRFLAADDKIRFWLEMNSIVDIFTIPPTFISYYLKSNWLGLRFLRALRLLELPQILQILRATRTSNSVKISKLISIILSTWFTAAGFIHLVENSGDPWIKGRNSQTVTYFESIYLVMATTSTVGFGDVVAKTSLGRTFIMFFTLGSLVLFANYVPEMVELLVNKRKYTSSYEVLKGKKFIVVCGNITVDSVTAFLRNFLRRKSGEINTEIVFLGEVPPSLELETIFKCYMAYTTFISGSALKWEDLRRVAVESAEACLIIANPLCSDSHAEDTSNIMRVLSIKNYSPTTRVIIQILQSHNKVFLPKIPSWNWDTGDNIICFAELKLGFIAQGCLVPGLCTFLTCLFVEQNTKVCPKRPWQKIFLSSLKNKILTQRLSDDFAGMSFPEVSRFCFVKLHLMLIAIEHEFSLSSYCGLLLNPPAQVRLHKNTLGFFIAESAKDVKRAFFYCATCHSDVYSPELIGKCCCKSKNNRHFPGSRVMVKTTTAPKVFSEPELFDPFPSSHLKRISALSSTTSICPIPRKPLMAEECDHGPFNIILSAEHNHHVLALRKKTVPKSFSSYRYSTERIYGNSLFVLRWDGLTTTTAVASMKSTWLTTANVCFLFMFRVQHRSGGQGSVLHSRTRLSSLQQVREPEKNMGVVTVSAITSHSSLVKPSYVAPTNCLTFLYEDSTDSLDSTGMFHWCRATRLDKVILKRTDKAKHEFRNHIVVCIFGDAHSTLMGLRNFVMPLRASNYTRRELKDIVFVGSLDYLQREWRFLRNFPQIYILPGSALYAGDLYAVNIEECAMCAVLSSPSKSPCQTLVDTETIMATLNIGSLRISCSASTPSDPEGISQSFSGPGSSKYRRVPILTELKNPSNIHFIEQLGGMEGHFPGTSLHLSTSFSTGAVFSGSFLDSLLATAFYNYHVLELLQMLVTGGISSQMEYHLGKDKFQRLSSSFSTILSERKRCKLGLLSLHQSVLLNIEPKKIFGQVFCGLLDHFGILCLGLYRRIDDAELRLIFAFSYRFVITRPANRFKLLPSDLLFCAIPFNVSCYEKDNSTYLSSYETINIEPGIPGVSEDTNSPPATDSAGQTSTQSLTTSALFREQKSIPVSSKSAILTRGGKLSLQTHPGRIDLKEPSEGPTRTHSV